MLLSTRAVSYRYLIFIDIDDHNILSGEAKFKEKRLSAWQHMMSTIFLFDGRKCNRINVMPEKTPKRTFSTANSKYGIEQNKIKRFAWGTPTTNGTGASSTGRKASAFGSSGMYLDAVSSVDQPTKRSQDRIVVFY